MKAQTVNKLLTLLFAATLITSCSDHASSGDVWEDTKTLSRHLQRQTYSLFETPSDSKIVARAEDFSGPCDEEFIPLDNDDLESHFVGQPSEEIEEQTEVRRDISTSASPSVDLFQEPKNELANIFKRVHFDTDKHTLRQKEHFATISHIAEYMKDHKEMYLFVMGHCDQRASESYNMILGTKRANAIKQLLAKRGVNPARIYTVSLGKEMPLDTRNNKDAWAKNRRVEFKLYKK